jgi:hypothetical protein
MQMEELFRESGLLAASASGSPELLVEHSDWLLLSRRIFSLRWCLS